MKPSIFKGILLMIASFTVSSTTIAQSGEFVIHDNGLIYNTHTMDQLTYIVDALNLQYKACKLDRTYFAEPQAVAQFIRLKSEELEKIKKQMDTGISFEAFAEQYPGAENMGQCLVTQSIRKGDLVITTYHSVQNMDHSFYLEGAAERSDEQWTGKWIYKDMYREEGVTALYFIQGFKTPELPALYGRLVQYVDCMVDTSASIYTPGAKGVHWGDNDNEAVRNCLDYVDKVLDRPVFNFEEWEKKSKEDRVAQDSIRQLWYDKQEKNVRTLWDTDIRFRQLLDTALESAQTNGGSTEEFEEYVEWLYSKAEALELKRGRRVVGMCSMDTAPREHAVDIARLSAETVNWPVFLRAHLDVMNDRFHRVSDGNYAWSSRSTYLRELEELQINVPDLMFGMCLRVGNPSQNHYFGSINRIGRALSETQQPDLVEARFLEMIADEQLDDFNRLLLYFAYTHYCYHQEENEQASKRRADVARGLLPAYLQEGGK